MKIIHVIILIITIYPSILLSQNNKLYIINQKNKRICFVKENKGWNKSDTIEIELNSGFNDTLIIYLNNKVIYHNYAQTNESTSIADVFVIRKSKMKLEEKNYIYIYRLRKGKKEKMLGFYLNLRYKYISVSNLEECWVISFNNTYHCCAE